jgi:hypothetical protein
MKTQQTCFFFAEEMDERFGVSTARFVAQRWHHALFHLRVLADIWADIKRRLTRAGRMAYDAEQADAEAAKLLRKSLADGIDRSDAPAIRIALAHVETSERKDRQLVEEFSQ